MSASEGNQAGSHTDSHARGGAHASHDAHAHAAHGAHDAHHGPPPPAEPHTPMWLPAVGAVLFLTVGLLWALSDSTPNPADPAAPQATTTATATAAPAKR